VTATVLDSFKLTNKRALITGAGKGLGKVMAGALAQAGADVAISARTLSDCETVASEIIQNTGRRAVPIAADCVSAPVSSRKSRLRSALR